MSTLNQGYIRKLYNAVAEKYESVAKNVRTIMKTSLEYAFNKNVLATNPAKGINLSKKIKKTEYRVLKIDEKKTLTLPQVLRLVEASKETPIHMQILFAVLMGLRRSEINGLKYSDVDYIHRTLRVERQLGKKPNSKAEDCAPKMLTKQEIKTKHLLVCVNFQYRIMYLKQFWKNGKLMRRTADADQKSSGTGIIFVVLHMGIQGVKVFIRNTIKTC